MAAEEQYFYNTLLQESVGLPDTVQVYQSIEQHKACRYILGNLENTPRDDPRWDARMRVLQDLIEHHIQEEEERVFEIARKMIDSQEGETVGNRFTRIKQQELNSIT